MYCSADDIKTVIPDKELVNLTQDDPRQTQPDKDMLNKIISLSDELIDGYLRTRYTLPFVDVPELIRALSIDISVYKLYSRRPRKLDDTVKEAYSNAVKTLESIQKGIITLAINKTDDTEEKLKTGFCRSNKDASDRVFTRDFLEAF